VSKPQLTLQATLQATLKGTLKALHLIPAFSRSVCFV